MPEAEHPAKTKRWLARHKVLTGILVIVVLIIIGASASGGKTPPPNAAANSKSAAAAVSTPGLNQQADDGKLGFTVTSFQCGINEINQPGDTTGINSTTQGAPYCEVNLTVKGVGSVAQTFDDDAQYIYSAKGTQYSVDDYATSDANNINSTCMDGPTVNPGTTVTCTLVFDVPTGVTPSYAILHDSAFSNGVKVNL